MANVAVLRVDIDSKGARRGASEVNRALDTMSSRGQRALRGIETAGEKLRKVFFSLKGAIAAVGLIALGRQALRTADEIGKVADKVGLTTTSLQELRFAAEQSGVAQATLDMAMQRFSRRVGEAAQGTGELKDTLIQYGIEVRNAQGGVRDLDDILGDLADAMQRAGSDQERLRIAFKAFDSEGAALVNLLSEGASGVQKFRDEAQRLGIVLEESMIRQAEDANDKLNILSRVISINLTRAFADLAPVLANFSTKFVDLILDIDTFINKFRDIDKLGLSALNREIADTEKNIVELDEAISQIGTSADPGFGIFAGARKRGLTKRRLRQELRLEELRKQLEALQTAASEPVNIVIPPPKTEGATNNLRELNREISRANEGLAALSAPGFRAPISPDAPGGDMSLIDPLQAAMEARAAQIRAQVEPAFVAKDRAFQEAVILRNRGLINPAEFLTFTRSLNDVNRSLDETQAKLRGVGDDFNSFALAGQGAAAALSGAFGHLLTSTESFEGQLKRLIIALSQVGLQAFVLAPLQRDLQAAFQGGAAPGGIFAQLGGLFGFQHGGSFVVPGPGGVDSRFIPMLATPGERVTVETPSQQARRDGGGTVVNVGGVHIGGGMNPGGKTAHQVGAQIGSQIARAMKRNN